MRHFLMIAALLCAGVAAAKAPLERSFHARVQVSAEGAVEAVETQEGLPAPVAAMVQEAAQKLAFTPATVDGEPAASKTTVWVRMRFEPGEGDELVAGGEAERARLMTRWLPGLVRKQIKADPAILQGKMVFHLPASSEVDIAAKEGAKGALGAKVDGAGVGLTVGSATGGELGTAVVPVSHDAKITKVR